MKVFFIKNIWFAYFKFLARVLFQCILVFTFTFAPVSPSFAGPFKGTEKSQDINPKPAVNVIKEVVGLVVKAGNPTEDEMTKASWATLELWEKANHADWSKPIVLLITDDRQFTAELHNKNDSSYMLIRSATNENVVYYHDHTKVGLENDPEYNANQKVTEALLEQIDKFTLENFEIDPYKRQRFLDSLSPVPWNSSGIAFKTELTELYNIGVQVLSDARSNFKGSDKQFITEEVDKNKLSHPLHRFGKVEIKSIDGIAIVRVVLYPTKKSYMFLPEGKIKKDSHHLGTYISKQHFDAGVNLGIPGRDVVVVWVNKLEKLQEADLLSPAKIETFPKFEIFSQDYWVDYWHAIYKKPEIDHVVFGMLTGSAQFFLALTATSLKYYSGQVGNIDFAPALLSFAWGSVIGAYISTFKNFTNNGTPLWQWMKNYMNSYAFGFVLMGLINPEGFGGLFHWDLQSALMHISIASNVAANSLAKSHWYRFSTVRDQSRITSYPLEFGIFEIKDPQDPKFLEFKKNFEESKFAIKRGIAPRIVVVHDSTNNKYFVKIRTLVKRSDLENQIAYGPAFFIRILDYIGLSVGGWPLGTMLMWSSIPLVEYAAYRYVAHLAKVSGLEKPKEIAQMLKISGLKKIKFLFNSKLRYLMLAQAYYKMSAEKEFFFKENSPQFVEYNRKKRQLRQEKEEKFPELYPKMRLYREPDTMVSTCDQAIAI